MSRLLRRMGQSQAAEEQESLIRSVSLQCFELKVPDLTQCLDHRDGLRWHKFSMSPSEFVNLVTDPELQGTDFIMEHPEMREMLDGVVDFGNGMAIHFG